MSGKEIAGSDPTIRRKNVAAGFSLRPHRLEACATKAFLNGKVIPDMVKGLLVPKLPLGNPLGSKALLCRAYDKKIPFSARHVAQAKLGPQWRSQAGAWERVLPWVVPI